MKKLLFLLPLLMLGAFCFAGADNTGAWGSPTSVTQVSATAVTGTAMWSSATVLNPWKNASLFPYGLTKSAGANWPYIYPIRAIFSNNSAYTVQVWYQPVTPSGSSLGVFVPSGQSYIWPSPMPPSYIWASTTSTAAVTYGVTLWR